MAKKVQSTGKIIDLRKLTRRRSHSISNEVDATKLKALVGTPNKFPKDDETARIKPKTDTRSREEVDANRLRELCGNGVPTRVKVRGNEGSGKADDLKLISKKFIRFYGKSVCAACQKRKDCPFEYKRSTKGTVRLCVICDPKIRERSFGKTDVLDRAILTGQVESNRRRH